MKDSPASSDTVVAPRLTRASAFFPHVPLSGENEGVGIDNSWVPDC